tara:strand:- start:648 stop:1322 length:675 start_codon:yes stop_codon:yes gene_type:complete
MGYSLNIGDNEYELPADILIDTWVNLNRNSLNHYLWLNSVYGIPFDEIKIIPENTKTMCLALISALLTPDWKPMTKEIKGCTLMNFDDMTLGEFIDMEVYIDDYFTNYSAMIKILYGLEDTSDVHIGEVHSAMKYFLTWRLMLYKQYKNLFDIDIEDDTIVEVQQDKRVKPAHQWYDVVMTLADGKFLNMDDVTSKPLIQSLNWLAWNKDKVRAEIRQMKRNKI